MCGFSGQVVQILDYLGVAYKGVNVLEDDLSRQGIKDYSNWPTIPQLYVKGEFVGGCDIIARDVPGGRAAAALRRQGHPAQEERVRRKAGSDGALRRPFLLSHSEAWHLGAQSRRSGQIGRRTPQRAKTRAPNLGVWS